MVLLRIPLLLMLCIPITAQGQGAGDPPATDPFEMSLEQLGRITITASKSPRSLDSVTQKVDIIPRQAFRTVVSGHNNLAEQLQYLPGAAVRVLSRNDANWGAYGGIGPKYVTTMVQGLPVDGFMDQMTMGTSAIERIEIQRGPASVLYANSLSQDFAGNQSPLAGTINIIPCTEVREPFTLLELSLGSWSTWTGRIVHRDRIGPVSVYAGVMAEASEYTDYGSPGSWLDMQKNPAYRRMRAHLGFASPLDGEGRHTVTLFVNQMFHTGDVGRENRDFDHAYTLVNAGYTGLLSDRVRTSVKIGFRSYARSWQEDNDNLDHDLSLRETDGVDQRILPMDASVAWTHAPWGTLTAGVDVQHAQYTTWREPAAGGHVTGNDAAASQGGVYMQEEVQAAGWLFRGGLRVNTVGYAIDMLDGLTPGERSRTWTVLLWSVGVKHHFDEGMSVFANAGSSFLTPALKSIGGTLPLIARDDPLANGQLPNPDLRPERGVSMDLGADARITQGMRVSLRGFLARIDAAIMERVISSTPSKTMSVNTAGYTLVQGLEIGVRHSISVLWSWFANATFARSIATDPDTPDLDGAWVPFVPDVVINAGISARLPMELDLSVAASHGGGYFDSASKSGARRFTTGAVVNVVLSRDIPLGGDATLLSSVSLYNLTDNRFDMPWQFRDTGRAITFSVGITF